jgi:uncharacterized protein
MKTKEYLTWTDVEYLIDALAKKLQGNKIEVIVAISRGGFVPARLLADRLSVKKLYCTNPSNVFRYVPSRENTIFVDDICDTGKTIEKLRERSISPLRVVTLHSKWSAKSQPDEMVKMVPDDIWIVYPWEKYEDSQSSVNTERPS